MNPLITILWPRLAAPHIDEIVFSYDFCRKVNKRHCKDLPFAISWKEYAPETALYEMLSNIQSHILLIVTEPELILPPAAVSALAECAQEGHMACGPVFNHTLFSAQAAALPSPYLDIPSLLEVAEAISLQFGSKCIPTDTLDPACILLRTNYLKTFSSKCLVSKIAELLPADQSKKSHAIVPGALVHAGFQRSLHADRSDLASLVPKRVRNVLDVGCAMGGYGKTLKNLRPEVIITGIELNPLMAEQASPHYNELIVRPLEEIHLDKKFDLVNCGDVMEHLQDPWAMLKRLHALLYPDGYLVLSVPNIGHWTIVRRLMKGEFEYVPLGLLCIGHLRWFTESSLLQTLSETGFAPDEFQRQQLPPTPKGEVFIRDMFAKGYGDEQSLRTNEFIVRARKIPMSGPNPKKELF